MDMNNKSVLEILNKFIASYRLSKIQILQMVKLVAVSNDINDLRENLEWEAPRKIR